MKYGFVIPTYNDSEMLGECVSAILRMTVKPDVVTIVDDGSRDGHARAVDGIVRAVDGKYGIRFALTRIQNSGTFNAINIGISQTDAEWVNGFSSDDIPLPDYWKEVDDYGRDFDIVAIGYEMFGEESARLLPYQLNRKKALDHLKHNNYICGLSPFRRSLWERVGWFKPHLSPVSDYAFWLEAAMHGAHIYNSKRILARVRVRSNSLWHSQRDKEKEKIDLMRKELGICVA